MGNIDMDQLASDSISDMKFAMEKLAVLKGWNLNSAKGLISCAVVIVKHAESVGKIKGLTGVEKQQLAVAIILKFIKLPWWVPMSVVRPILEGAINAIVEGLKEKF